MINHPKHKVKAELISTWYLSSGSALKVLTMNDQTWGVVEAVWKEWGLMPMSIREAFRCGVLWFETIEHWSSLIPKLLAPLNRLKNNYKERHQLINACTQQLPLGMMIGELFEVFRSGGGDDYSKLPATITREQSSTAVDCFILDTIQIHHN